MGSFILVDKISHATVAAGIVHFALGVPKMSIATNGY